MKAIHDMNVLPFITNKFIADKHSLDSKLLISMNSILSFADIFPEHNVSSNKRINFRNLFVIISGIKQRQHKNDIDVTRDNIENCRCVEMPRASVHNADIHANEYNNNDCNR